MRILHITAEALRGGCEKNCYHFIGGSPGHKHTVIVLGKEGPMSQEWRGQGVDIHHLDILSNNLYSFMGKLRRELAGSRNDLCICWSTVRLPVQLDALADVADSVKVYLGNPVGDNYRPVKDRLLSFFLREPADVTLMACSQYVMKSHQSTGYFQHFPIKPSLNPVQLPSSLSTARQDMDGFRMGMVARLDPIKDHKTILKGFAKLLPHIPSAELNIVGDGKLKTELIGLAAELGISTSVKFHGDVNDVYAHLRTWHVFAYATTPQEGLGSAVAEAMANGLACLLSDLPMLRELAPTDDLVEWFPEGNDDALASKAIELFKDTERRKALGRAAFLHAQKNFGVNRFIADYMQ